MATIKDYPNLEFSIADDENVTLEVEVISNMNSVVTDPNISVVDDEQIVNSGTADIGSSSELVGKTLRLISSVVNAFDNEDRIIVDYKLNGRRVKKVNFEKAGEENWTLILTIKIKP